MAEREEPKAEMDVAGLPVLVVDDNPTNLRILERTLLQWGMKPTLADSGGSRTAALRQAKEAGAPPQLCCSMLKCREWTVLRSLRS